MFFHNTSIKKKICPWCLGRCSLPTQSVYWQLYQHDSGEHDRATQQLAPREALAQDEETAEGGKNGLKAEYQRGHCRIRPPLADDLEGIGDTGGKDADIGQRPDGGKKVRQCRLFQRQADGEGKESGDKKLHQGEGDAVHLGGEVGNQEDVDGEDEGSDEDVEVADV